jgi:hypothetical protein
MIDKDYFARQALTLFRLAKAINNPALSATAITKAADLEAKAADMEEYPPPFAAKKDQPNTSP